MSMPKKATRDLIHEISLEIEELEAKRAKLLKSREYTSPTKEHMNIIYFLRKDPEFTKIRKEYRDYMLKYHLANITTPIYFTLESDGSVEPILDYGLKDKIIRSKEYSNFIKCIKKDIAALDKKANACINRIIEEFQPVNKLSIDKIKEETYWNINEY